MDEFLSNKLAKTATVHIVDDDDAVLDSVSMLLDSIGVKNRCYSDAEALLHAFSLQDFDRKNGCILLDLRMPVISGIECQQRLKAWDCQLPIIFLTGHADVPTAVEAMKNGAIELIQKPFREQQLIEAIQKAILANLKEQDHASNIEAVKSKLATLTHREKQILDLIVSGSSNKKIAESINLSKRTVEIHRAHVMEKMNADSLADLLKMVLTVDSYH